MPVRRVTIAQICPAAETKSSRLATFVAAANDSNHPLRFTIYAASLIFDGHPLARSLLQLGTVRPLVSFVIPVRNDVLRLQRCLTSITRNVYPRELIEIIVVDNDSTDGSAAAAKGYGAIVIKSSGTSVAAHRNRGARAALGSIIAFADSDHEIDRHWIETAVEVLCDPNVAATGCAYLTQPSPNWVQQQYDNMRARPSRREDCTWLGSGNIAVKRAAFERIGGFNETLTACEDVDLCNRLRLAGYRIVAEPDLRSIHFGDPKTLKALFFGELWRGRDNLRVTFSGPRTFRNLRSAVVPMIDLACLAGAGIALVADHPAIAMLLLVMPLIPAAIKAAMIVRRRGIVALAQAFTVVLVFDTARALALVARGNHRARRAA